MLAEVHDPLADEVLQHCVVVPLWVKDAVEHNLLALGLGVGYPAGQGVKHRSVELAGGVAGDPDHVVVRVHRRGAQEREGVAEIVGAGASVAVAM